MTHRIPLGLACLVAAIGFTSFGCGPSAPPVAEVPPPPVTVSQPLVRKIVDQDNYEGRIAASQVVEVRARVRGHLTKVAFQPGQLVTEKELLFEIDRRPYKAALDAADAQLKGAIASLELAEAEYARNATLAPRGAISREDLEVSAAKRLTTKADRLKAEANVEEAKLNYNFTLIHAPLSGKISRQLVDVGNLINAGSSETLLATIVSVDPMYVYFDVDERSLLRYRRTHAKDPDKSEPPSVKELNIPVFVALEGEEGYPHQGVIDYADNRVNPSTGTIQVRGILSNANRLFEDGLRARVRVPSSDPHEAIMVTERAIGSDQGRKFVYVVNDKDVVERRDVMLERVVDGLQVIREGLKPTDWVIVNGIQRVRDGMTVRPKRGPMPDAPAE